MCSITPEYSPLYLGQGRLLHFFFRISRLNLSCIFKAIHISSAVSRSQACQLVSCVETIKSNTLCPNPSIYPCPNPQHVLPPAKLTYPVVRSSSSKQVVAAASRTQCRAYLFLFSDQPPPPFTSTYPTTADGSGETRRPGATQASCTRQLILLCTQLYSTVLYYTVPL